MADPRNAVGYNGIRSERTTYTADGVTIVYDSTYADGGPTTMIGKAVTLSGNHTIALAADGETVLGKLILIEPDGQCAVQDDGFCTLPGGNGATLTAGLKIVGALNASSAKGYIRGVVAPTGSYVQGTTEDNARGRHMIIDSATATAVVVKLS